MCTPLVSTNKHSLKPTLNNAAVFISIKKIFKICRLFIRMRQNGDLC